MGNPSWPKIGHFKDVAAFAARVGALGLDIPCDERCLDRSSESPLALPLDIGGFVVGNRWCIHPMEGWDGSADGRPTEHTLRRWQHFGESGAKLIWGGEAFAVQADARANPNQIGIVGDTPADLDRATRGLESLHSALLDAHQHRFGRTSDLLIGLQLTHSGRFCKPFSKTQLQPRIAYHHPFLDRRFGIAPDDDGVLLTDDDLKRIIDHYIRAARLALQVGFHFVDVKHCHGYLAHELLSGFTRPGPFGGSLENRTRFAREIVNGIQADCPGLRIGVRLSAFDAPPFHADPTGGHDGKSATGVPVALDGYLPYRFGFGCDPGNPLEMDLTEPIAFVSMLHGMGVRLFNISGGSPYYNPHMQRPAMFPPSDGYEAPEDPLVGVARQIEATRKMKQAAPADCVIVGSGYSYLQEFLPNVAQAVVRKGWADSVGIGRAVLSYWDLPADTLEGAALQGRRLCRTFSDCTTAPRNGIISGCFPLDPHYKNAPEHAALKTAKAILRNRPGIAE